MHILLNVYFECSSGPRIEDESPIRFALLFFGAGIAGNLLSDAWGVNGVGGSTACYGIIGMDFAMFYQKWPEMTPEFRNSVKSYLLQTTGMLLLWEIILWKEIDHFGHLGGFLGGGLIVMGRVDCRFLAVYFCMLAGCIYAICIRPLSQDTICNGDHCYPWQAYCDEWRHQVYDNFWKGGLPS
jgi:membrane associated rhomboid family serine protease